MPVTIARDFSYNQQSDVARTRSEASINCVILSYVLRIAYGLHFYCL
jgi:hypothetical protein